ncbi:MAG: hypothetical protein WCC18_19395 [Candidatus Acidiferrales bacterium]
MQVLSRGGSKTRPHNTTKIKRVRKNNMECGGAPPLSQGEARLAESKHHRGASREAGHKQRHRTTQHESQWIL